MRRAFHQSGDIDKFHSRRNHHAGLGDFAQHLQPRVRHGDDADVRGNGAKGIIRRLGLARPGDGVEQGGFPDVGQTDDSSF